MTAEETDINLRSCLQSAMHGRWVRLTEVLREILFSIEARFALSEQHLMADRLGNLDRALTTSVLLN